MWAVLALSVAHVPTYSGCTQSCCTPPHRHDISQVVYLKGSGGLQVHIDADASPLDVAADETIDFDVVLRDAIDQSTYALFVGCGGCLPSDPIVTTRTTPVGYEPATVEPFT